MHEDIIGIQPFHGHAECGLLANLSGEVTCSGLPKGG